MCNNTVICNRRWALSNILPIYKPIFPWKIYFYIEHKMPVNKF